MSEKNLRELSKDNWLVLNGEKPNREQLIVGTLQRIADATEAMTGNFLELQREVEQYRRWYREEKAKNESLERKLIARKSAYTKLKNKYDALKNGE